MQDILLYPRYMAHQLRTKQAATVVGKLIEVNSKRHSVIIETDTEAKMAVEGILNKDQPLESFEEGRYYEIRGVCRSGRELDVSGWTCFGLDFGSYNQMLNLATKEFKSIFYS